MSEALAILERSISDVGYWRWWTEADTAFQIEFGWVMLLIPSDDPSLPPSSIVTLRFNNPRCIVTLQRATEGPAMPDDWFAKLGRDEIEPFRVCDDSFTLTNAAQFRSIWQNAVQRGFILGNEHELEDIGKGKSFLGFWAENVGLAVVSESVEVLSHRGRIEIKDIEAKSVEWWKYWRRYWDQIDSDNPLPEDSLCEITIPAKDE